MMTGAPYDAPDCVVPVAEKVVGRQLPLSTGKLPPLAAASEGSRPLFEAILSLNFSCKSQWSADSCAEQMTSLSLVRWPPMAYRGRLSLLSS